MNDELDFVQPKKVVGKMINIKVLENIKIEIEHLAFKSYEGRDTLDRQEVLKVLRKIGVKMSYCDNCLHNEVCCDEGKDDALTYCADKLTENDAYEKVFRNLCGTSELFKGKYDTQNVTRQYMLGIHRVMNAIANKVSPIIGDAFSDVFFDNMSKSEESFGE